MKEVILKVEGLCKSYANEGRQNHVLSEIDLEIYSGDFTVIMGPSGSGKSTLLYCISGMDKVTSGRIIYEGKDISKYKERELVYLRRSDFGFVFQQMHLVSNLSLIENVVVPGYLNKGIKPSNVNERGRLLMETVGLTDVINHLPKQASGGEQQRAAIARALISEPRLVFADEPTGALNKKNGNEVLSLFSNINKNGQSILMVTHDIRAAIRANRILYLEDGKIIGELNLRIFQEDEAKSREAQVSSWLSSMSW